MIEDLNYRKIKNFLRKHSSNINDENSLRLSLMRLFYYDIYGYPISLMKPEEEINWNMYPSFFKNKTRLEIIDIYNKEIKSKCLIKILNEEELNNYDINENNYLEISLKTFRPVYIENWKEISEKINKVPFTKQKSFYAEYLRCYLKLHYFPSLDEFIKYLYYKTQLPIHKDIKIVFNNIEKSYKEVKEFININDMSYNDVRKILINSIPIQSR